jgi:hypothetical protein
MHHCACHSLYCIALHFILLYYTALYFTALFVFSTVIFHIDGMSQSSHLMTVCNPCQTLEHTFLSVTLHLYSAYSADVHTHTHTCSDDSSSDVLGLALQGELAAAMYR